MYVKFDMVDLEQKTKQLDGNIDQIPFVMAGMLNDAAFDTRAKLVNDTWPSHVTQRKENFPNVALSIEKATKSDLTVEIYDRLERPSSSLTILKAQASGGVKTPRGRHLAIPSEEINRKAGGAVQDSERPKALVAKAIAQKGQKRRPAERIVVTEKGIFSVYAGRFHLLYTFAKQARVPPRVPFYEVFNEQMRGQMQHTFALRMQNAMKTRR
jgi:hypothetical protein